MIISNWEILYTTLIFLIFILITSLNSYLLNLLIKNKQIKKIYFWSLLFSIVMSEILIVPAVIFKIVSFTIFTSSYQLEVTTTNWLSFCSLVISLASILIMPKQNVNLKQTNKYKLESTS
ncbi:hypothetical protein [Spiroplasma eriocheiris]|uniref:Transmembrane protein n=1 Tax=Spiroplasma eriocheiris TaxID=315358 RepID=A0A0H3XKI0_9MOLU|nr:hypothetical protein [Spiroplasma eriocheiris]AHF57984.1 hypothetical protein SPE_0864 [Spiroplasma eriocheiris CCTCC M 207170]AKM54426.1 hypothetical protein SERIO_v1c08660 [Spiroplasma eriocheiris]